MSNNEETDKETSGFTEDLPAELEGTGLIFPQSRFENITPIYVSRSGSAQLLSATRYGKRFVLKCLKEDFRYNPVYRTALLKEFEIGIALDHPNIRSTIGFEEIEGYGPSIILEYIDGETLENILTENSEYREDLHSSKRELPAEKSLSILSQIASALDYLHSKQVIHRDLKPANVMVTFSGNVVKLIDFSLSDSDSFTVIKIPAGTRSYMAPELLSKGGKANARTDIYSFGMIMKEMNEIIGDRHLSRLAEKCTDADPNNRPYSIRGIQLPARLSRRNIFSGSHHGSFFTGLTFSSAKMTGLLIVVNALAALWLILVLILNNHPSSL